MKYALLIVLLLPAMAWGASGDWFPASSVISCAGTWTNCDSTYVNDSKYAVEDAGAGNDIAGVSGFGADPVPSGATVDSFVVGVGGYGTGNPANRDLVVYVDGGTGTPNEYPVRLPASDDDARYTASDGAAGGKWGQTWTVTQANAVEVHMYNENSGGAFYMDLVELQIWYTEAAGGKSTIMRIQIDD